MQPAANGASSQRPDRHEAGPTADDSTTYVTFGLSDQTFGLEVSYVREILDQQRISRLPNAPHDCEGVIDTRGESIPVIDLAGRLGMPRGEASPETRIIVLELTRGGRTEAMGVVADRVLNVTRIADTEIEETPPAAVARDSASWLRGLTRLEGHLVVLLDVTRVFGSDSFADLDLGVLA
jgi:purine-binding chemotaxis protein CheW